MKITIEANNDLILRFSEKERENLLFKLLNSGYETSRYYLNCLANKIRKAEKEKSALPIFILAANLQQAKNYAKRNNISKWEHLSNSDRVRGYKKIVLHFVGSWEERSDLGEIFDVLRAVEVESVYENL